MVRPPSPVTPITLPRQHTTPTTTTRSLALIDVDNIVLTAQENNLSILDPDIATRRMDYLATAIPATDSSYAVISDAVSKKINASAGPLFFRYPQWTWRITSDTTPDAADLELLHHARTISANGGINTCYLASGDSIFSELSGISNQLLVVVPDDHDGIAKTLQPFHRRTVTP